MRLPSIKKLLLSFALPLLIFQTSNNAFATAHDDYLNVMVYHAENDICWAEYATLVGSYTLMQFFYERQDCGHGGSGIGGALALFRWSDGRPEAWCLHNQTPVDDIEMRIYKRDPYLE